MSKGKQNAPDTSGVPDEIKENIISDSQMKSPRNDTDALLSGRRIGISVSDSEELGELGYSSIHLRDLMIEIVRYLLINRAVIVYGGDLRREGYTQIFSDLAFQYRAKNESKKMHFENYFSYPIYCLLENEAEAEFRKNRTKVVRVPPPEYLGIDQEKFLHPDTLKGQLIWAISLSQMRLQMISMTDARILVGGKLSHYVGKMPGIIEEAKITLELGKPLYMVGTLGGATKEVIHALEGDIFRYPENAFHQTCQYQEFRKAYNQQTSSLIHSEEDALFFKNFGLQKLSQSNGLTVEENRRLFTTTHLSEILYYIFKGLKKVFADTGVGTIHENSSHFSGADKHNEVGGTTV